ncbi:DUF6588 family protein [Flavobacterium sp.]|uniref:DUF6588 family protein n=1 Tax=Flavobacterium sp. TaxID=239 RepID=UPI003753BF47
MRKIVLLFLLVSNFSFSQSEQLIQDLGYFIDDALFFSDKYITPATDAAVYQSSSAWVNSAKKRKIWDVTIGINSNIFIVPNRDREFQIYNSDFSLLTIDGATTATIPTALGNDYQVDLIGDLDGQPIRIETPKGINQSVVVYPHLFGAVSVWYGTEILLKYSPKIKLKRSEFQVYGIGLKHNLSQYFKCFDAKKINLATAVSYSKEDVSFDFLDVQTDFGNLGINRISGLVDTYQLQVNASKEYKKFEFLTGLIANVSNFKYELTGPKGAIEETIPLQYILNQRLKEIYKTKSNFIAEVSCRYQISKIYVQSTIAFGKFVNSNLSVQYDF